MSETLSKNLALGVVLALVNALALAAMSLFVKKLSPYFGPFEVTFFRNLFSVVVLFVWIVMAGKMVLLKTQSPWKHLFRGTIGTIGIVLGAWALSMMPLAETTVLLFTSPLFTVLLSYPVLGERVGVYRLSAVAIGFLGVVMIANPFGSDLARLPLAGVLIGLGWGFSSGMVDVWLRLMGKTENANTTTFYFVLFGTLVTGLHWPWAEIKPDSFSPGALWIILGLGITGLLAQLSKTHSYRLGEASVIAPMMYTMIVWAMVFDYMFWDKGPAINVIAGAAIIIASNIFILYREKVLRERRKIAEAQVPPPDP